MTSMTKKGKGGKKERRFRRNAMMIALSLWPSSRRRRDFLASLFCGVIGYEIALLAKIEFPRRTVKWWYPLCESIDPSPAYSVRSHPSLPPFPCRKRILCGQRKRDGRTMMMITMTMHRFQTSKEPFQLLTNMSLKVG